MFLEEFTVVTEKFSLSDVNRHFITSKTLKSGSNKTGSTNSASDLDYNLRD